MIRISVLKCTLHLLDLEFTTYYTSKTSPFRELASLKGRRYAKINFTIS